VALRIAQVKSVAPDDSFAARHARLLPEWPPRSPVAQEALTSAGDVIRALSSTGAIIGIQREEKRRGLWIGVPEEIAPKWLWLDEIRPDASWKGPLGYKLKSITAIEVGTRYLTALERVAGTTPPSRSDLV
jgi:hypothetical protein